MSDFHLKFAQCHGCLGYDKWENMQFTPWQRRVFADPEARTIRVNSVYSEPDADERASSRAEVNALAQPIIIRFASALLLTLVRHSM